MRKKILTALLGFFTILFAISINVFNVVHWNSIGFDMTSISPEAAFLALCWGGVWVAWLLESGYTDYKHAPLWLPGFIAVGAAVLRFVGVFFI
jgi:hypothetical protein